MARFVAERHHEEIDVPDIAKAAGVHPKYAMRVFRRTCGMTLLQFLTQNRVRHAQRLLATEDANLHEIAEAAGFGSDSRFREVFKRSCGVSPAAYRASLRR
jgi:AraC-like DNA-binding protein